MPDLDIIGGVKGSLGFSAVDLKAVTKWPDSVIEDYLNLTRVIQQIVDAVDGDFGTMALQNADDVNITGGTIAGVTLDDFTIGDVNATNVTTVNLTATGTVNLHDVTVTGYFHSEGLTDDATENQITITDSLVDIHQDTDLGFPIDATFYSISGLSYSGTSYASTSIGSTTPINFFVTPDGLNVYGSVQAGGINNLCLNWHRLATPWVFSGMTFMGDMTHTSALSNNSVWFKPDGTKVYLRDSSIYEFSLSTPWDITTETLVDAFVTPTNGAGLFIRADGLKAYAPTTLPGIDEFDFGTAWDLTTISYNKTLSIPALVSSIMFDPTGFNFFTVGAATDAIRLYQLSVGWDISTAAFVSSLSVSGQSGNMPGLFVDFSSDDIYTISNFSPVGRVYRYSGLTGSDTVLGRLHITDNGYYTDDATSAGMGAETFNSLGYYENGVYVPTISSVNILTNKTISLDDNVLTANSPANGQIPIYGATAGKFDNATLTAGNGINIANADTSITISVSSANEATDTTCFLLFITNSGTQTLQPKNNTTLTFNSNTSIFGAGSFNVTGTAVPANGLNLPAASTLGFCVNTTEELRLTATALSPTTDGGNSLGTTALGWQNLFGNTGFVVNIENGNWVATHTSGLLTIGTGDLRLINNLLVDGDTRLGDTDTDAIIFNAGTWTLANNIAATRAAGTVAAGLSTLTSLVVTATGDAGGTSNIRGKVERLDIQGGNAVTQATASLVLSQHTGSATVTAQYANLFSLGITSTGGITTAVGSQGGLFITGAGNITNGYDFLASAPAFTSTGAITTLIGFGSGDLGHATLVTNAIGHDAPNMTAAATLTVGYRSGMNSGTGKWGFLHTGTANNAFNGNVRIGSVVAPTVALDVTGAALISTTLGVTGNVTFTADLAVNGGDITTSATTFNFLAATATTINIGAGATAGINIGNASGPIAIAGNVGIGVTATRILSIKAGSSTTLAQVGGVIAPDFFTDATAGGAEADIYSTTIGVSVLATNGDKIIAVYGGNFVTVGTELTQLKVMFDATGATTLWDSTALAPATGTTSWRVNVEIIRVSSTVIRYTVSLNTTGATGYVYCTSGEVTGLTLSGTNILRIRGASSGVGSGSGDIVGKQGYVEWKSAS